MQAYTVEQVAEMLHIGRDKVYYLLRTGQLRSIKIGKLRRITDRHLAEFVASLETPPSHRDGHRQRRPGAVGRTCQSTATPRRRTGR